MSQVGCVPLQAILAEKLWPLLSCCQLDASEVSAFQPVAHALLPPVLC